MRSSTSSFKGVAIVAIVALALGYLGVRIVQVQAGFSPPGELTEPWFSNVARFRQVLYSRMPSDPGHTIFIVAGSNGLFGTNSPEIERITGYQVRNYSLHAGLSADLLFSQITDKVHAGDLVVAPLEWGPYNRRCCTQFDYANYLHHFSTSVHPSLSLLYKLYSSVPLSRWWAGLENSIFRPAGSADYWDENPISAVKNNWDHRSGAYAYSAASLTPAGDFNMAMKVTDSTWDAPNGGGTFQVPANGQPGIDVLVDWKAFFASKGAKLMVVSPVMLESKTDGPRLPDNWKKIEDLREQAASSGVIFQCDPLDAVFARRYRLDTPYHLNAAGALLRSTSLGECIKEFLDGKEVSMRPIRDPQGETAAAVQRIASQE